MIRLLFSLLLAVSTLACADERFAKYADKVQAEYQLDREEVLALLESTPPNQEVLKLFTRPATSLPFDQFEALLLNERRINNGVKFLNDNNETLLRAEASYGVPRQVITAIIGVETAYGANLGRHKATEALITLGFYAKRRQDYFRYELTQLLVAAREHRWNLNELNSSYAGALGICQFMPSNVRKFAVDFDGDGTVDLLNSPPDAIGSVANYLRENGWRPGELVAERVPMKSKHGRSFVSRMLPGPEPARFQIRPNYQAIKRYNPSDNYVMTVFILAESIVGRAAETERARRDRERAAEANSTPETVNTPKEPQ